MTIRYDTYSDPLSVPDYIEPLFGYRTWVATKKYRLNSLVAHTCWEPRRIAKAVCRRGDMYTGGPFLFDYYLYAYNNDHYAPDQHCECGLYAVKDLKYLRPNYLSIGRVLGLVALWGEVHEHEWGYRAKYAYPVALSSTSKAFLLNLVSPARRIAAEYGIAFADKPSELMSVGRAWWRRNAKTRAGG